MSEMRNTIQHYLCKLKVITAAILDIAQSNEVTTYQSGVRSLLLTRKRQCEQALASLETFTSHGDFPELSQYCSGDHYDTDGEESQLVPEEDPKSDSDVLDGCCKDQLETDNLDSDMGELSIMSMSSEQIAMIFLTLLTKSGKITNCQHTELKSHQSLHYCTSLLLNRGCQHGC